jgi:transposase InsO family protein
MPLTMKQKHAVTKQLALEYKRAGKKRKGEILDSVIQLTDYNRSYAARVLRERSRPRVLGRLKRDGVNITLVEDERAKKKPKKRPRKYDKEVFVALRRIWVICDCICGKRLGPYLPEIVDALERWGELEINEEVRKKLIEISPATIDRLLAPVRKRYQLKARSNTKPGTLLKHQIPIRTFSEWDEARPGFVEIDLVSHEGGDPSGDYIQTLDLTDVCTGWTETRAVRNKAQVWVFEALQEIMNKVPFAILGIDSDNGSEFINGHLYRFCKEHKITFTRSRPYRKNDNCFVEQKNYSVVRKVVGYQRHDTEEELEVLNELYDYLRLHTNFFQPVMKLIEKLRIGSKVKKKYDRARTPYQRVLESSFISRQTKEKLEQEYAELNPVRLNREISRMQDRLSKLAWVKRRVNKDEQRTNFEYIST